MKYFFFLDLAFKHVCTIALHKPVLNPKQNQEKFNCFGEASDSNTAANNWSRPGSKLGIESPPNAWKPLGSIGIHSIHTICCCGPWTKLFSEPMLGCSSRGLTGRGPTQKAPGVRLRRHDSSTGHSPSTLQQQLINPNTPLTFMSCNLSFKV